MQDDSILSPKKHKTVRHAIPYQISEKNCAYCGGVMIRPEGTQLGQFLRRKTCSSKCQYELMAKNQRDHTEPKICAVCGIAFTRKEDELLGNYRKRKTCSNECRYIAIAKSRLALRETSHRGDITRVAGVCASCGEPMTKRDNETDYAFRKRRTCGKECQSHWIRLKLTESSLREPRECLVCGSSFLPRPKEPVSDFRKRKTCSAKCRGVSIGATRKQKLESLDIPPKWCVHCGLLLEQWQSESRQAFKARKTCSYDCAYKQAGKTRRISERATIPGKPCAICGELFYCRDNEEPWAFGRRKTCSWECRYESVAKTGRSGEDRATPYPMEWNRALRDRIRDRDGRRCAFCDSTDRPNVHHVDYSKNNCRPENLLTLCPSCHAKTTNGDRSYWYAMCTAILVERGIVDANDIAE